MAKAHRVTLAAYGLIRAFPRDERFGLTAQLRRCSASIGAKIAEGSARSGRLEFRQFLTIALGSAAELEYHLILARDLGYVPEAEHRTLDAELAEVKRMLVAFIQRLASEPANS